MLGGVLSGFGMAASSFTQSISQLFITAGFITGQQTACFPHDSSSPARRAADAPEGELVGKVEQEAAEGTDRFSSLDENRNTDAS